MKKKVLFIDRDGTLVLEPEDYQLDHFGKLKFYPEAIQYLARIARELDYELVMVTNQDGLGTESYPEDTFWPIQELLIQILEGEGVFFEEIIIDRTFPEEMAETRKPKTGLLKSYFSKEEFDLENSYVIGDRLTDMELAKNLGSKGIFIHTHEELGSKEISVDRSELEELISFPPTAGRKSIIT